MNQLFQWTHQGSWRRGRKAIVDGSTYYCRFGDHSDSQWLMSLLPSGELTFVPADELEVAPEPGPTKEEINVPTH